MLKVFVKMRGRPKGPRTLAAVMTPAMRAPLTPGVPTSLPVRYRFFSDVPTRQESAIQKDSRNRRVKSERTFAGT